MTPDDPVFINSEQILNINHLNLWFTLEMPLPAKDLIFNQHQLLHGLSNSKSIHKKYTLKEKLRIKYAILDFFKELSAQFIDVSLSFKKLFHD